MTNNITEIDASGSHKHWFARGDNSVKNGTAADEIRCLRFGSISLYFCVSIHIQTRKAENTSWMREVCYWQLKSQIPADQHSRAGPNSQPTMTRIHNK